MKKTKLHLLLLVVLSLCSTIAFSQEKNVTGIVTDSARTPLQGVTVKVKGGKAVTITNQQGSFTIPLETSNATLQFSSVGYATKEMEATAGVSLSVTMGSNTAVLGEVVVTAM